MTLIDTHAHIYPDAIAAKAARSIGTFYDMPVGMNGTVDSLLAHGTAAGISRFLVQSVAVTWERAHAINDFIARSVAEHPDRFIGFGAIHPAHPDIDAELDRIMVYGFKGIKLHPDIQQFCMDDPAAIRLLEAMEERHLALLVHAGDKRYPYSQPERIARALDHVPSLRAICAHLGGWSVWSDAWKILAGRSTVWVDTSSSLFAISPDEAVKVIHRYGASQVFFGTDYPMWRPEEEVARFAALPLTPVEREQIAHKNFEKFIGE